MKSSSNFLKDIAQEAADTTTCFFRSFDETALQQRHIGHSRSIPRARHAKPWRKHPSQTPVRSCQNLPIFRSALYSHMGGKIVVAVILTGGAGQEALAREIAMHVAAESPEYLRPEDVPQEVRAKEEEIARSQVQGKPANIVDKIVEGKIKAFCDEVCLVCQKYVKDNTMTIAQLLEKESKRLDKHIGIKGLLSAGKSEDNPTCRRHLKPPIREFS